jgi:hypothetical protein
MVMLMNEAWSDWARSVERRLAELDHVRAESSRILEASAWFVEDEEGSTDLHEVIGLAIGGLRTEMLDAVNDVRQRLDMPIIKARVRVPAGTGRTW